jgi:hypothetical protein
MICLNIIVANFWLIKLSRSLFNVKNIMLIKIIFWIVLGFINNNWILFSWLLRLGFLFCKRI